MKFQTSDTKYKIKGYGTETKSAPPSTTEEKFKEHAKETKERINWLTTVVYLGFIILLVMVAAMVIDSFWAHIDESRWLYQFQQSINCKK